MDAPSRSLAPSYRSDPAVPAFPDDRPVIIFDGQCALCSGFVGFILKHDRHKRFRLAPAQSKLGAALYAHYAKAGRDYETHMLIENGEASFKSTAAIRMVEILGPPWSLTALARVVASPLRDWVYDRVARNRIFWFGARQTCFTPPPQDVDRFLA